MDVRVDLPEKSLPGQPHAPVIGLMFHDVTDRPSGSGFLQPSALRYKHTRKQFQDYLTVVGDSELPVLASVASQPNRVRSTTPSVVFTFDDGGSSAMIAADLLEDRDWRGTFLVTTDLINTPGFLTEHQIVNLHRRGHVIGSHSCSHPDIFRQQTRHQKFTEWNNSRQVLEQLLDAPITVASIPGGDMDDATIEEAAAAGLKYVFTSELSIHPWRCADTTCFGRAWMLNSTSPQTLSRWLRHPVVGLAPERGVRFAKNTAKTLLGPVYQRMMRHRRAVHEQS